MNMLAIFDREPTPSPRWLYDLQDIHDNLVHSFQNRHIYPVILIYIFHAQIKLPRLPPSRPPPLPP